MDLESERQNIEYLAIKDLLGLKYVYDEYVFNALCYHNHREGSPFSKDELREFVKDTKRKFKELWELQNA